MQQKIRRIKKILISFLVCCVLVLETPSLLLAEESTGEIPVSETAEDTADETVDTPQEPQPSAEPTPTVTQEPMEAPEVQESIQGKAPASATGWKKAANGRYRYYQTASSYLKNGWHDIGGKRYYFESTGYVKTGWFTEGNSTYYLKMTGNPGQVGVMLTGWQSIGGQKYYFKASGTTKGKMFVDWQSIGGQRYYFTASGSNGVKGRLWTGWLKKDGRIYYLKSTGEKGEIGRMVTGWQDIEGERYYFKASGSTMGTLFEGWQNVNGRRYYFKASGDYGVRGRLWKGWLKQSGKIYYLKKTGDNGVMGRMFEGWQTIGGKTFYFKKTGTSAGALFTGFQSIGGKKFYFKATGDYGTLGYMFTGWQTISSITYYFEPEGDKGEKGQALTGWNEIGKYRFYFMQSGDHKGKMLTGLQSIGGVKYFFKRTGDKGVKGAALTGAQSIDGVKYFFDEEGRREEGYRTIKGMIANAMKPMGYTLYIWGGGHDAWSGGDAVRFGVNPHWKTFFDSQGSDYTYTKYREDEDGGYYYGYGLDCSGYVGWTVYNTVYKKSGQNSCTSTSGGTGELYADRGWGSYKKGFSSPSFRPGDVVGYDGHVWMILGKCSDGSYVILHSSPQGVKLSGTVTPSTGSSNSKAVRLANQYMDKYFSAFPDKFPNDGLVCGNTYLKDSGSTKLYRFRWSLSSSGVMDDPDGYVNMSAEEILEDLFC